MCLRDIGLLSMFMRKLLILARSTIPHFDLSLLTFCTMGSSRFWLKVAYEESKCVFRMNFPDRAMSVCNRALPVGDNASY